MDVSLLIITAGGLSTLLLEGVKIILRQFILNDATFDFPAKFYLVAIPVLNVLVIPLLALLQVEGSVMPADWLGFARTVVLVLIASLITLVGYSTGVQPLKQYAQGLRNDEIGG